MIGHKEALELIPVMALDALGDQETNQMHEHLKDCRPCADLLAEHLDTASWLALSAQPVGAPKQLRDRLLGQIEPVQAGQPQHTLHEVAAPVEPEQTEAPVATLPARGRWARAAWMAAAAAMIASVVLASALALKVREQDKAISEQALALEVISNPAADSTALSPQQQDSPARGRIFIDDGSRTAVLVSDLGPAGDGVYTLWRLDGQRAERVQDLEVDDSGVAVAYLGRLPDPGRPMAITLEPEAGADQPAGPVIVKS